MYGSAVEAIPDVATRNPHAFNKKFIIFKENHRPILATKIRYYEDKVFSSRICDTAQVPELNITSNTALPVVLCALDHLSAKKTKQKKQDS